MQGAIHCALQGKNFTDSVRMTIAAGGGNCARSMCVGALVAAQNGGVAEDWIQRTTKGAEVTKLAQSLSGLRQ